MVRDFQNVGAVAHVIQLAVAPVFLLTAIGTLLSVMTNRLARVIDRARIQELKLESASPDAVANLHSHLATLSRRADLIGHAITLCTCTAVLVCTVIALLFVSDYLRYDMSIPVAALFVIAALIAAMTWLIPRVWRFIRALLAKVTGASARSRDAQGRGADV